MGTLTVFYMVLNISILFILMNGYWVTFFHLSIMVVLFVFWRLSYTWEFFVGLSEHDSGLFLFFLNVFKGFQSFGLLFVQIELLRFLVSSIFIILRKFYLFGFNFFFFRLIDRCIDVKIFVRMIVKKSFFGLLRSITFELRGLVFGRLKIFFSRHELKELNKIICLDILINSKRKKNWFTFFLFINESHW